MNVVHQEVEQILYPVIYENLDDILRYSNDINDVKENIKIVTYYYLLETEQIYINENKFKEIIDVIKTTFWDTTINTWTGKISMGNWLSGIGFKLASTGKFTMATSGLSELLKGLGKLAGRSSSAKGVVSGAGAIPSSSSWLGNAATSGLILRVATLSIFPTVLLGLLIYRLVKFKDIYVIKNFESALNSTINRLRLTRTADFKNDYKNINKKYENILKNNCANITDRETKLKCASSYYIKYMTEDLMVKIIKHYVISLKKQNLDISYIHNFQDLAQFKFGRINDYKQLNSLYEYYIKLLDKYDFNNKKSYYIKLLDNAVVDNIKEKSK